MPEDADASRTLTSAWIETYIPASFVTSYSVALSRVRGLKPIYGYVIYKPDGVALSRVRGLKPHNADVQVGDAMSHSHECVD